MKLFLKSLSVAFAILALATFFYYIDPKNASSDSQTLPTPQDLTELENTLDREQLAAEQKLTIDDEIANTAVEEIQPDDANAEIKAKIEELKAQLEARYQEIYNITGPDSGQKNLSYEDDWCLAYEDLTEQEQLYANEQLKQWRLSRGDLSLTRSIKGKNASALADEHLVPYKEMEKTELSRLANEDDFFALSTIVQSTGDRKFSRSRRLAAAHSLVWLGDTSRGLGYLVMHYLVKSKYDKENPIETFKNALTFVEYGLMRGDLHSVGAYLSVINRYKQSGEGVDPSTLSESDFTEVSRKAKKLYKSINQKLLNKGLPSFDEVDHSKAAIALNRYRTFRLYDKYSELLESPLFPSHWQEKYLEKTPCVQRRIAMHNFRTNEEGKITEEIRKLQQSLADEPVTQ